MLLLQEQDTVPLSPQPHNPQHLDKTIGVHTTTKPADGCIFPDKIAYLFLLRYRTTLNQLS